MQEEKWSRQMYQFDDVKIRKFEYDDIPLKIEWINDPKNNKYLHYDLPLEYEKTCKWFLANKDRKDRFDCIVEYQGKPIGLIGLLGIDKKNNKAEEYITIGDTSFKGKGIGTKAGLLLEAYAFLELGIHKLYSYAEVGNISSIGLYRKRGFRTEGYLNDDLLMNDRYVDRVLMCKFEKDYELPEGAIKE